ncbi:MAG: HAD family hydrolase [Bacteroidaceae bacterium]|nr:HAD family hydrolase [Bacteroidaceae bacterium]
MVKKTNTTLIFDLDGTLLNTLEDLYRAVNEALRMHGMPQHTLEEIRWMVGNGVKLLVERAVPKGTSAAEIEQVFSDFRTYYTAHSLDTTRPYEGITEMLAQLKGMGIPMAVVSNKMDAATRSLVQQFFGEWIDVAIGDREGLRRKPAPDMVFEAMQQLKANPAHCIFVGDSDVDFLTAVNANIPCLSVLWGFRDRKFLESHGATIFIEKPEEIVQYCSRLD